MKLDDKNDVIEIDNKNFVSKYIQDMNQNDSLPYAGAKKKLIELLFFKWMTNADIKDQNPDDLGKMYEFSRMLNTRKSDYDAKVTKNILNVYEKKYSLSQGTLDTDFYNDFKDNFWTKLSENINHSYAFHYIKSNFDYTSALADLINRPQGSKDTTNTSQYYTNESLQRIVAKILKVQKTETFMDCCCGMFSSSFYNDAANYIGIELDKDIVGTATKILMMCGKKFDVKNENFVESKYENIADKIFADIPYGVEMPKMEERPYGKNGEAYCIENVVKALKDGGTAVVVCSGSVLGKQDSSKKMREAITKDHLKAVVALPPMNIGSKINTNLIVLEKNCCAKDVKFVNATSLKIRNQSRMTLGDADIADVVGCLGGKRSKCPFKNVPVEDILYSGNVLWTPNSYVSVGGGTENSSVEEIERELKEKYRELKELFLAEG